MWKEFIITLLFVTTVVFATSFFVYYYKLDNYKKEKEVSLNNKEIELNKREQNIKNMEDCSDKLTSCLNVSNEIRQLLGSVIPSTQSTQSKQETKK